VRGSKSEVRPGVWRLRAYTGRRRPDGSPVLVTRTVYSPDRKPGSGARLADRELARLVAEVSEGKIRGGGTEPLSSFLDDWLQHLETLGRSPTTLREYRRIVDRVVKPELGKVKLSRLSARQLDDLYAKLTTRGLKPTSVRHVHTLLGAALHQAERWGLVDINVSRRAQPPSVHVQQAKAPEVDAVQAIIAEAGEADPTLGILLFLGAVTGARRGELCALRWSDFNTETGILTIARSVYQTTSKGWAEKPTKTHQARRVALDDYAASLLMQHRDRIDELADKIGLEVRSDAFMFSRSPEGSEPIRPNILTDFTSRIAKRVGVKTHFHELRHFSATQLIADGHDVRTVAGRLGHADPSVTLRVYSHALPEQDRKAAATLGRLLAPQSDGEIPQARVAEA
jgi:integrase